MKSMNYTLPGTNMEDQDMPSKGPHRNFMKNMEKNMSPQKDPLSTSAMFAHARCFAPRSGLAYFQNHQFRPIFLPKNPQKLMSALEACRCVLLLLPTGSISDSHFRRLYLVCEKTTEILSKQGLFAESHSIG